MKEKESERKRTRTHDTTVSRAEAESAMPRSDDHVAGRRPTSTSILAGLLITAALLTTAWTAANLQPVHATMAPAATSWSSSPKSSTTSNDAWTAERHDAMGEGQLAQYERVSERFLLRQLARAFLAAPWLLPDAGVSRTQRPLPLTGWAFPSEEEEAEEGEEQDVDEGVMLSESASILTAKKLRQLGSRSTSGEGGSYWQDDGGESSEDAWWQRSNEVGASMEGSSDFGYWNSQQQPEETAFSSTANEQADDFDEHGWGSDVHVGEGDAGGAAGEIAAEDASQVAEEDDPGDVTPTLHAIGMVSAHGHEVAIGYAGPLVGAGDSSSSSNGSPFLELCSGSSGSSRDWLCASARDFKHRSARFELLPLRSINASNMTALTLRTGGSLSGSDSRNSIDSTDGTSNRIRTGSQAHGSSYAATTAIMGSNSSNSSSRSSSSSNSSSNSSSSNSSSSSGSSSTASNSSSITVGAERSGVLGVASWFALRSLRNGGLVQAAPMEDDEAWVIRARGEPLGIANESDTELSLTSLELWRSEGEDGLRNLGTGALINFRGDTPGGEGVAVRCHGDTKPRRAAINPTPTTKFILRDVPKSNSSGRSKTKRSRKRPVLDRH